jgi:hypothetical protein
MVERITSAGDRDRLATSRPTPPELIAIVSDVAALAAEGVHRHRRWPHQGITHPPPSAFGSWAVQSFATRPPPVNVRHCSPGKHSSSDSQRPHSPCDLDFLQAGTVETRPATTTKNATRMLPPPLERIVHLPASPRLQARRNLQTCGRPGVEASIAYTRIDSSSATTGVSHAVRDSSPFAAPSSPDAHGALTSRAWI